MHKHNDTVLQIMIEPAFDAYTSIIAALGPYTDSAQYCDGMGITIIFCSDSRRDTVISSNYFPGQLKEIVKEHIYVVSKHVAQRKFRIYCMMRFEDWSQFDPIDFL